MKIEFIVAVVTSALLIDMAWITARLTNLLTSKSYRKWYTEFHLGAVLSDIMSCTVCILLVALWLPLKPTFSSILQFCSVAVGVQVVHDLSLYQLTKGFSSPIMTLFKEYGDENGMSILFADASIIASTVLLTLVLQTLPHYLVVVLLLTALYILPYLIYSL